MRRLLMLICLSGLLAGCTAATESTTSSGDATTTTETTSTTGPPPPDPETPSTTEAAETTTSSGGDLGSREAPVPLGETARVGDYEISVTGFEGDATQAVLDENQFNEPPADGSVFSLISLSLTYVGTETGTPWVDLSWSGIGDSNVASEAGDCSTYPGNMIDVPELFPDGTAEGNVCLTVADADVDSLVLILEESFSLEETRVFFALH